MNIIGVGRASVLPYRPLQPTWILKRSAPKWASSLLPLLSTGKNIITHLIKESFTNFLYKRRTLGFTD